MRRHRLLSRCRAERGTLVLQSIPAIVLVLVAGLGTVQAALVLYGSNVVRASAHEAARSAIELGATRSEARHVSAAIVERSAGRIVDDLEVAIAMERRGDHRVVTVVVTGHVGAVGPIPVTIPVRAGSTAIKEPLPR